MLNLNDRNYKVFTIGNIFNVFTGSLLPKSELRNGQVPRITASETTNGIIGTYMPSAHKNYRTLTNFISVSFLGGVFYHPYRASLDMKIHALQIPKIELNKDLGAYLVSVLKKTVASFSYGDQLSSTDLPKKKVLLPIDKNGNPDWQFMTDYMRTHEKSLLSKYEKYLVNLQLPIKQIIGKRELGEFKVSDLFKVISGKDIVPLINNGQTPYINSSGINNGITNWRSDGIITAENIITIARTGTVGATFYQPFEAFVSGNIRALQLKNGNLNRYSAHYFITAFVKAIEKKFNYGKILGSARINDQKIILPIRTDGKPDWAYMEAYEKERERELIIIVKRWLAKRGKNIIFQTYSTLKLVNA